jgi:hypothetical protein
MDGSPTSLRAPSQADYAYDKDRRKVHPVTTPRAMRYAPPLLLLLALLLTSCGRPEAHPTPHGATLPPVEMGCFAALHVIPVTSPTPIDADEAEARARATLSGEASSSGPRRSARLVQVLTTEGHPGLLGGKQVWLLALTASPTAPSPTYALVDATSGQVWNTCTAPG